MRVIHFQRKPFPGSFSIEGLFENLRAEMKANGVDVELRVLPWYSKGFAKRMMNLFWAARHQADINHVTGDVNFLALAFPRRKTILTILDLEILNYVTGTARSIIKLFWYDLPIRRAGVVTVISESTKRTLLEECRIDPGNVVVIPVSISKTFKPSPKQILDDPPRILQIGTKPHKNIDRLLIALEGLDCHLHLIGRPTEAQRKSLADRKISHTIDSNLTEGEIYDAYCHADIVSLVSTAEGFGMPIVEAQCVERPVVTSNCSSMPEVAGRGACLVDPYDPASIRNGFVRIIRDPLYRAELVSFGRSNRERFTVETVARAYIDLYRRFERGVAGG